MPRETPSAAELQGVALREAAKKQFKKTFEPIPKPYPSQDLVPVLVRRFDELGINWNQPRTTDEITMMVGASSLLCSFHYACLLYTSDAADE